MGRQSRMREAIDQVTVKFSWAARRSAAGGQLDDDAQQDAVPRRAEDPGGDQLIARTSFLWVAD